MPERRTIARRLAVVLAAVLVPAAVAVTAQQALAAVTRTVTVDNDKFTPASLNAAQGDTVRWSFVDDHTHTATDATGMGLYDSNFKTTGTYDKVFAAAGSYPYRCKVHSFMTGKVNVALKAAPASGTAATTFTITWSSTAPATGLAHDVQIKRPGATAFVAWKTGITSRSATFKADAGAGQYQFRSRLRNVSTGKATGYSAARSITVA